MGLLFVLTLLIESGVIMYLEYKAWKSIFTPLSFLLLPYLAVLMVSIAMSGRMDFVEFYYPSIIIWIVGLFFFAVPDFLLVGYSNKHGYTNLQGRIEDNPMPRVFVLIGVLLVLLFSYRLLLSLHERAADAKAPSIANMMTI